MSKKTGKFLTPGVYVEEVSRRDPTIEGVATTVVGFVFISETSLPFKSVLIHTWGDYLKEFGEKSEEYSEPQLAESLQYLSLAIYAFYRNGGENAYVITSDNVTDALNKLSTLKNLNTILLPSLYWDSLQDRQKIEQFINDCENNNRMIVVDTSPDVSLKSEQEVIALSLPSSSHVVTYYPWLIMPTPSFVTSADTTTNAEIKIAPSAFAAAIWSRTDIRKGIWNTPAGVNSRLSSILGLTDTVSRQQQSILNPLNVNVIKDLPRLGTVIWGGRTLASGGETEWRYINVRRTAIFIEQSIKEGTDWAVFEPNNHHLWQRLKHLITNFLDQLFRRGAFQGSSTNQAFFVKCGLGETMTEADVEQGNIIVQIGFAPLRPAEFVIIQLRIKSTFKP